MTTYTITATCRYPSVKQAIANDDLTLAQIKVRALGHLQHIWNEATLIGVSAAGARRLAAFTAIHSGENITVNAGPHHPRLNLRSLPAVRPQVTR